MLELKARRDRGEDPFVLDVREPHEYQINRIPGLDADPARRSAAAVHGARREPRDRVPVQVGHAQRARRSVSP